MKKRIGLKTRRRIQKRQEHLSSQGKSIRRDHFAAMKKQSRQRSDLKKDGCRQFRIIQG